LQTWSTSPSWVKAVSGQASDITVLPTLCKYRDYLAADLLITKAEAQVDNAYSAVIKNLASVESGFALVVERRGRRMDRPFFITRC